MGKRTEYPHGAFSWVDLMTTDLESAKSFYSGLFDWSHETRLAQGDAGEYMMFSLEGAYVAGAFALTPDQLEAGVPPNWFSYVNVDDVDGATTVAREAGGTVRREPFDVIDAGRMSVIEDPQGAVLGMWEPKRHTGAQVVNEPGALTWNELRSPDPSGVMPFYERLFGWSFLDADMGGGLAYTSVRLGDRSNGGMIPSRVFGGDTPAHWAAYFAVENTDKSVAKVEELGGKVIAPPMDVPMGRFAAFLDPQGAACSIFSGQLDP
jgi:uncharacterized protein